MAAIRTWGGRTLAACVVLGPTLAAAQSRGATKLGVYVDTDETLVITPIVAVSAAPNDHVVVDASYMADMVTASSTDLVSAATEEFAERRDDLALGGRYVTDDFTTYGLGYDISHERDYLSNTFSVNLAREVLGRNVTVSGAYAVSLNEVGRSGDPSFSKRMTNHSAILSASQVLGPEAIAKLTYHGQWSEGFHSSVYRYASVYAGERLAYQTPERLPDERARHAVVAAMNARLVGPLYGQADYRFYGDSWGLYGHTAGLRLVYEWSPDLSLRVRERLATQGSVSFYEPRYQVARTHMTTDKELTALWSSTSGIKVEYGLRAAAAALGLTTLSLNLKVDFMHISYSEFERIEFINAQIGEAGVAATF